MTLSMTQKTYPLPEGYTMRPATIEDVAATVEMLNVTSQHLHGKDEFTIETITQEWTYPGLDLARNTRLVETQDGQIVAYFELWDVHDIPAQNWLWWKLHPNHYNQGIESVMMAWAEDLAKSNIERCPPQAKVSISGAAQSTDNYMQQAYDAAGMTVNRNHWNMLIEMTEAPPAPQLPDHITIRSFNYPDEARSLFEAVDESFQDHFGYIKGDPDKEFAHFMHEIKANDDFDPAFYFVAVDTHTNDLAGMSLCLKKARHDPEQAWVDTLGVRRPWRRQGIALALLQHSFGKLWDAEIPRVGLGVDASSLTGATKLYKKAGMHVSRNYISYEKILRDGEELATVSAPDETDSN